MYVRVAVDTGAASGIDFLTYSVPAELANEAQPGLCVLVPLGSRQTIGFIVGYESKPAVTRTKDVIAVLHTDVRLAEEAIAFAEWLSDNYLCPLPLCIKALTPPSMNFTVRCDISLADGESTSPVKAQSHQTAIKALQDAGGRLAVSDLKTLLTSSDVMNVVRDMEKKGLVSRVYELEMPRAKPRTVRMVNLKLSEADARAAVRTMKAKRQADVLQHFVDHPDPLPVSQLMKALGTGQSVIGELERKGFISIQDVPFKRSPNFTPIDTSGINLTSYQDAAVKAISGTVSSGQHNTFLMHGVTASGKTEVYLRSIETALSMGRSSVVLLPEISLTSQVLDVFKGRFGDEVAVIHSKLSTGERYDEWMRISDGEARVVIGARSALFAPVKDLGLIVVDEEHEPSYKQESEPRYHARDAAVQRGQSSGAAVVLGSATPAVESYYTALQGGYSLLLLPVRVQDRPLPVVEVADLREEYVKGTPTIFSAQLKESIEDCLGKKQQVILFQNRRAYATFLLCRECGHTAVCPDCAVTLKFHSSIRILKCHHCDYEQPAPTACPSCGGSKIGQFGIGTERVEEETRKAFPDARVLRMDKDTTTRKDSHREILTAFRSGEADILIGTQMVAKGLDFPRVTLVGVISADTSLRMPDFRAPERTFQLLSQVAGRAGRGDDPGRVIIQSFDPDCYSIQCAVTHDYIGFYEQEIAAREELNYPPFSSFLNIISSDPAESAAQARVETLAKALKPCEGRGVSLIGPAQAAIAKLRGDWRWHLLMKSADRAAMLDMLRQTLEHDQSIRKGLVVDVDPVTML